jgi:hypothetical protein
MRTSFPFRIVVVALMLASASVARAQALDGVKLGGLECPAVTPRVMKHTLDAAKKFEGRKYGEKGDQLVCTTYAIGVLEEAGYVVGKLGSKVINIQWGWSVPDIERAVADNDPKAAGVVYWLLESKQGEPVRDYKDIKPGDFVQYWRWVTDKKTQKVSMAGHTAQVKEVLGGGKVRLHGSHLSKGGVGLVDVNIIPTQRKPGEAGMYRTYVVRPVGNPKFEK